MPIQMKRSALPESNWSNAGLFFDRGFKQWDEDDGDRGKSIRKHIDDVCNINVPEIYIKAYRRWLGITHDNSFAKWFGRLEGRMFIGLGGAHVLETQVMRHSVYGIPMIPGSALKGLVRAKSEDYGLQTDEADVLFGKSGETPDEMDAGYLIFHDAWWVPEGGSTSKPYARDIVTVHAQKYYESKGKTHPHPDMESPNPNHQLAVQGSFYFVIEGLQYWAELGMKILICALQDEGIGGKVAAGYGYFTEDTTSGTRGSRLAKQAEEERTARDKIYRNSRDTEREGDLVSEMSPSDKLVYNLQKIVKEYDGIKCNKHLNQQEKEKISTAVNNIFKSNKQVEWTTEQRENAVQVIEAAYSLFLKAKDREKKQKKIDAFLQATTGQ